MSDITVVRGPDDSRLNQLGVFSWPIWTKESSTFPWSYGEKETCCFVPVAEKSPAPTGP